jgi:hypothetical protein
MVATRFNREPKMLVTISTMQHNGGGKRSLIMCFSSQEENAIFAAALKTAYPSIEHHLSSLGKGCPLPVS